MSVAVVRLSSNIMQTSGTIGIVGLRNCCRFRCCLVAIMRCIKLAYLHIFLNSFMSYLGGHYCSFLIFWGARLLVFDFLREHVPQVPPPPPPVPPPMLSKLVAACNLACMQRTRSVVRVWPDHTCLVHTIIAWKAKKRTKENAKRFWDSS